jgi:antitoxin VapB
MTIAKVFRSGNSQAVRLPKKFRFKSSQVEIFRRGDEVVLRELRHGRTLSELLAGLPPVDFPEIPDPTPDPVKWPE